MSRTEDLSTKFRTLSYDHERLTAMHGAAVERAAHAEREMNLHKSRLAFVPTPPPLPSQTNPNNSAANRTLHQTTTAHKQTTHDLTRTRTLLHALRQTHTSELKKRDKDIEKMVDRWSKLSDLQLKLGPIGGSGMKVHGANAVVVENSGAEVGGKGEGYLEIALEQAEAARRELYEENGVLRG